MNNRERLEKAHRLLDFLRSNSVDQAIALFETEDAIDPGWTSFFLQNFASNPEALPATLFTAPMHQMVSKLLQHGMRADFRCLGADHILAVIIRNDNASGTRTIDMFKDFLSHGANPNAIALGGGTLPILHYAIQQHANDFISMLVAFGANPDLRAELGWNALDMCRRSNNERARSILSASQETRKA